MRTKHKLCDCVNRARREREDKMEEKTTMTKEMVTYVAELSRISLDEAETEKMQGRTGRGGRLYGYFEQSGYDRH